MHECLCGKSRSCLYEFMHAYGYACLRFMQGLCVKSMVHARPCVKLMVHECFMRSYGYACLWLMHAYGYALLVRSWLAHN